MNTDQKQHDAYSPTQCSPTDSGLDVDVATDPGEDSDSYITMSDSSVVTDNETTSDKLYKPVMMREFYKNSSTVRPRFVKDERKQSEETNLFRSLSINSKDEPKTIGNPETNSKKLFLRKSKQFFRNPKDTSSIFKSKSEGNIKELVEKEPRSTIMQSLYRGFSSLNFGYSEKMPNTESENTFLSLGPEVTTLNHNQENVSRMRNQEIPSMKSLPCLSQPESLLSCFALGGKQIKPNHRSVQRPRDIKVNKIEKELINFLQTRATAIYDFKIPFDALEIHFQNKNLRKSGIFV